MPVMNLLPVLLPIKNLLPALLSIMNLLSDLQELAPCLPFGPSRIYSLPFCHQEPANCRSRPSKTCSYPSRTRSLFTKNLLSVHQEQLAICPSTTLLPVHQGLTV